MRWLKRAEDSLNPDLVAEEIPDTNVRIYPMWTKGTKNTGATATLKRHYKDDEKLSSCLKFLSAEKPVLQSH